MLMLAKFPDPQPKYLQTPQRDWWNICARVAFIAILISAVYMIAILYGYDPLHLVIYRCTVCAMEVL